jgi:hypothetical protein
MLRLYYFLTSKIQSTELKLSSIIQKRIDDPYSSSIFYFNAVLLNLLLVFWQIIIDLLKFIIILSRDPGISFNIFFKQRELRSCPFSYNSFKNVQKQIRMFSAAGVTAMVIVAVVSSIVTNLIFGGKLPSWAATVNFNQSSWATLSATATTTGKTAGWVSYSAASSTINTSGNQLTLNTVASSTTQSTTTLNGFNLTGSATSSTIASSSVKLQLLTQSFSATTTDYTNNIASANPVQ